MQCRSHVAQLGRMNAELEQAGAQVLVILGGTLEQAVQYAGITKAPFPLLADPERAVYHCYGLEMGIFRLQRTASIILDEQGVIRYIKRQTNPMPWLQEAKEIRRAMGLNPPPS